ncbi:hypothetical protein GG804_06635 [Sphingomonas histidinilytica]|jgi:hypothetical protein|uniref:nuclear transport factor 2 family protein n=1 Tax=Rhizorhabdus histidinilytica TaxID=439228 RepID=UPI000F780A51|nr:nuclear transport factor 2 family protein [Rhizorhabdus histidinilytica]MBO9376439.1 hypothetical protein [Rhizorhabdus histidinilytica]QEH79231.1 nuclear transport factor 2 family protein [Sphingomonas sp. C8-2]
MSSEKSAIDIIQTAFAWFNDVGAGRTPLTREAVALHFHPEASIMIDTEMKGVGAEGMYLRFKEMQEKLEHWEATQPFDVCLTDGDKAAGHYQYRFTDKQGGQGVIDIVSIWSVRDGKVYRTIENATYMGAEILLATHG